MTVEYTNTSCDFVNLRVGEAFLYYADGERMTCMKVEAYCIDEYMNQWFNAVHLATGDMLCVESHQKVEKINARVIVE